METKNGSRSCIGSRCYVTFDPREQLVEEPIWDTIRLIE